MRPTSVVTARDAELLRTLLRVQVAKTTLLQAAFFTSDRTRQKRLQRLAERDYIMRHGRGLPAGFSTTDTQYWRVTRRGLEEVARRFPDEPIPDYALERASSSSLRYFEHRDALVEFYLSVVGDSKQRAERISRRAQSIDWRSERNALLTFASLTEGTLHIIPDAMVSSPARRVRLFVEIDRSTETRRVCRDAVKRYQMCVQQGAYARQFPDGYQPVVLYVMRNSQRESSLRAAFAPLVTPGLTVLALEFRAAITWTREALFGAADAAPIITPSSAETALAEAVPLLESLYRFALRQVKDWQQLDVALEVPPAVQKSKAFLRSHHSLRVPERGSGSRATE